jgi:hypothetical protein
VAVDRVDLLERGRRDAAVRQPQHGELLVLARIPDVDLEQEAVELRLRQRVGALVLNRVLRRDDEKRRRQRARLALDRHLPLLHRLEQRRLRLRRRAVHLVGEQDLREDGPRPERELAALQRHRSGQVRREHVRRELDATELEPERARGRVGDERLRHAGDALEQHVPADGDRSEQQLDGLVLADHDLRDLGRDAIAQLLHLRAASKRASARPAATTCAGVRGSPSTASSSSSPRPRPAPAARIAAVSASAGSRAASRTRSRTAACTGATACRGRFERASSAATEST